MRTNFLGTERISLRTGQARGVEDGKTQSRKFGHEELCQSTVHSVIATRMSPSLIHWSWGCWKPGSLLSSLGLCRASRLLSGIM